ncbi:MAG: Rieske 2Fe-2S domain-containing protein [Candidatus Marinimicrobia bacterium]|nr:Rieske 2Fe-2S domain-containing protein [Candidatus Neomarinimicrobiota bacterium]
MSNNSLKWWPVLEDKDFLVEGRVMTVTAGNKQICLTHFEGNICALDNHCPHQGGPLGEGSIEKGLLRCPWHGWDYHPCSGKAPGFDDGVESYPVKIEGKQVFVGLPKVTPHAVTIADVIVETMVKAEVNTVFGMVGHSNLGLADAMRRQEEQGNLKYIGIRHEGAAAFAASAYGKLTGRPAVCFAIAGPGSTNMFTGLWDARVDRSPLIALTGQIETQVIGTGTFQEVDLVQAFQSVTSFNHRVHKDSQHAELMTQAIRHAFHNREPVHLTFPDEVQVALAAETEIPDSRRRLTQQTISPPSEQLELAVKMISKAQRPVIVIGHGARFHMERVLALAERLKCPVVTTFKGKGLISDGHELAGGVLGRSGTPIASYFMNESDLLLVIGASFSKHTGITPKKPTIQIDFDPLALSKFHEIDCPVWGEISITTTKILEQLPSVLPAMDQRNEIGERWDIWRVEKSRRLKEDRNLGFSSSVIFQALTETVPKNAVICVDVGNNAYSLGRYFESQEQSFLMSGYLGSIGFALPAALGAWAAVGDKRPVVVVCGDGGLCQYLAELTTIVKYKMPIKIVVLNNNELGEISKEQSAGQFPVWGTDLVNPNFAELANSIGATGFAVNHKSDLTGVLKELFSLEGPGLVEIASDVSLV